MRRAITGLTADSREVRPGYLFAALSGVKTDGARFIADAVARGAAAILAGDTAPVEVEGRIPVIRDANPRRRLALMAARFHGRQPEIAAAVTGTNGKTSVASFLRQIWEACGRSAASLGTTGIHFQNQDWPLAHTTPDPVSLHASLAELADRGATHLAFEASSHGLAQYRVDGIRLARGRVHQHFPRPSRLSPRLHRLFQRQDAPVHRAAAARPARRHRCR